MSSGSELEQLERGLAIGAIGFGAVGVLAPRVLDSVYGLGRDPHLVNMTRLWGTRTAVLGAMYFTFDEAERTRMLPYLVAMNTADAIFSARAEGISGRSRTMGALSSAAFAGALGYIALKRR